MMATAGTSSKRKAESHGRTTGKPRSMRAAGCRDSERDSGFSDTSSEHMSTRDSMDSEASPRPAVQQGSRPSQLAMVGGSYSNLSPMIIMNNVLLNQPGESPPALKPWSFGSGVQQPQVVFLQPVVSRRASSTSKESSRHRRPKKYLPFLKSYPKIAPHPGDSSSSSGRGTDSSSSSRCSSSSGSDRGSRTASGHRDRSHRDRRQKRLSGGASSSASTTSSLPPPPSSMSPLLQRCLSLPSAEMSPDSERPASVISQPDAAPSPCFTPSNHSSCSKDDTLLTPQADPEGGFPEDHELADGNEDAKRKRFCNTYNILSKSGLLDITLRTKELLRQNRRSQSDLERLKEQTELFFQALKSGDPSICLKLQASLEEDEGEQDALSSCEAD
ncbi:CLOCK-interacting pacemaker [Genypterus blacodes]|uniref:CLOCK-interacting pacemaker n=1 Tax=Genypterus blacodes TaxID=154954 RepID=UPI003F76D5D3